MRPKSAAFALVLSSLAAFAPDAGAADGRATAEALLAELEAVPEDKALAKDLIARSRQALERARKARAAADHRHGAELESLSLELAETGRDLVRAAKAERTLDELERKTRELEARAVRARALVEQTVARRGRAAEQLERVQAERAAEAAAGNGKGKPAKAAPKAQPPAPPARPPASNPPAAKPPAQKAAPPAAKPGGAP